MAQCVHTNVIMPLTALDNCDSYVYCVLIMLKLERVALNIVSLLLCINCPGCCVRISLSFNRISAAIDLECGKVSAIRAPSATPLSLQTYSEVDLLHSIRSQISVFRHKPASYDKNVYLVHDNQENRKFNNNNK